MGEEKKRIPYHSTPLLEKAPDPESGPPGGGRGRKDLIGHTGVYRICDPQAPADAVVRIRAEWGQGERGLEGYYGHGASETRYIPVEEEHEQNNSSK